MTYKIGDRLSNSYEVSHNAIVVEIMHMWEDPDDGEVNYIIKCREVIEVCKNGEGRYTNGSPWLCEDELKLVNDYMLDKYYH